MSPRFQLKPPKIKLSENNVRDACLDLLALRGWKTVRINNGKFRTVDGRWQTHGEVGLPDYVAVHGRYPGFFLELKRPGGVLSNEQLVKIGQLQIGYRVDVAVIDSVERLADWLGEHGRSP